jgi:hypothetical protein
MSRFIILSDNGCISTLHILDFEKQEIIKLSYGKYEDITKDCVKLSKKKDRYLGGEWYSFLITGTQPSMVYNNDILIDTEDKKKVDKILLDAQKSQLESMLEMCNANISRYELNKQYYTYRY